MKEESLPVHVQRYMWTATGMRAVDRNDMGVMQYVRASDVENAISAAEGRGYRQAQEDAR